MRRSTGIIAYPAISQVLARVVTVIRLFLFSSLHKPSPAVLQYDLLCRLAAEFLVELVEVFVSLRDGNGSRLQGNFRWRLVDSVKFLVGLLRVRNDGSSKASLDHDTLLKGVSVNGRNSNCARLRLYTRAYKHTKKMSAHHDD